MMQIIRSDIPLGEYTRNIGTMFLKNREQFADKPAFAERVGDGFRFRTWDELTGDIIRIINYLMTLGLEPDDPDDNRVAFIAANHYQRMVCEMAVMSAGLVSVPIFAGYPASLMSDLLHFADVRLLITDVPDEVAGLHYLPEKILLLNSRRPVVDLGKDCQIDLYDEVITREVDGESRGRIENGMRAVVPSADVMIMHTSGTSGFPKLVRLTHSNLMSQQKALQIMWKPEPGMRFLNYLPWHHSFGGLFERFFALHSGGCLAIDDSQGKDIDRLLENFKLVRPNAYFSVPKIYQEIGSRVTSSKQAEIDFFHDEIKFFFTAAAPLPISTSDIFKSRKIPVVEGWGLTETSPCCTLTSFDLDREPGVVGFPIPGVELAMADANEILVRGPNVMKGYFRNPEATRSAFYGDGWFATGDIGEFTPHGLKIISRKERMFKLNNGEKIFPSELEDDVKNLCCYVKYSYVFGSGQTHPFMLVFPNKDFFNSEEHGSATRRACAHPRHLNALSNCLGKCIREVNSLRKIGFKNVKEALIIDRELSLEKNELTPSFKLIPRSVEEHYGEYISAMLERRYDDLPDDAHVIAIEPLRPERSAAEDGALSKAQRVAVENLHYGVIGTGPVGRVLAAHLHKSGHQVSVLAQHEEDKRQLDAGPVVVTGQLHAEEQLHNIYMDVEQFLSVKPDVVLICTKNFDSEELLKEIKSLHPPDEMLFVSCQNGLDVEEQIIRHFGPGRALRMVLNMGCGVVDSSQVQVTFSMQHSISDVKTVNPHIIEQVAHDLSSADFTTVTDENYREAVFKKVLLNASLGSVCALTRQTMAFVMRQPELRELIRQMVEEGVRIGQAMELSIGDEYVEEAMAYLDKGGEHKPSILVDIEKGRKTENEYHCGKLVEYARQYGVKLSVTPTIYLLIKTLEMKR